MFVIKGAKRALHAIKFALRKRAVEIRRIKIVFANGGTQEHKLNTVIAAGSESPVIDLVGKQRPAAVEVVAGEAERGNVQLLVERGVVAEVAGDGDDGEGG